MKLASIFFTFITSSIGFLFFNNLPKLFLFVVEPGHKHIRRVVSCVCKHQSNLLVILLLELLAQREPLIAVFGNNALALHNINKLCSYIHRHTIPFAHFCCNLICRKTVILVLRHCPFAATYGKHGEEPPVVVAHTLELVFAVEPVAFVQQVVPTRAGKAYSPRKIYP